jgi:hypothetical protein
VQVVAAPGAVQPAYRVEAGDVATDRERILALWQRCGIGTSAAENAARYDWFYLQNPQGRGRVYLLLVPGSDEPVGAVGVGARRFRARGARQHGFSGILVDFVVHPAHRSLYPALLLQRSACAQEFEHCGFLYGLPLARAVPVVARLPGATRFDSDTHVRVLQSAAFIRSRFPRMPAWMARIAGACADAVLHTAAYTAALLSSGVQCRPVEGQPPDCSACLEQAVDEGISVGERSPATLAWRIRAPGRALAMCTFHDGDGAMIGYAMHAMERGSLSVVDFLVPRDSRRARGCWLALARRASRLGAGLVRVEFGGAERVKQQLRSAGYMRWSSRPGYVIQRDGTDRQLDGQWWFTRFDQDI